MSDVRDNILNDTRIKNEYICDLVKAKKEAKKRKGRIKNKIVKARVTDAEKDFFELKAKACGMTLTQMIVDNVVDGEVFVRRIDLSYLGNVEYEIMKIGTNINQIAFAVNSRKGILYEKELEEINVKISELVDVVNEGMSMVIREMNRRN